MIKVSHTAADLETGAGFIKKINTKNMVYFMFIENLNNKFIKKDKHRIKTQI